MKEDEFFLSVEVTSFRSLFIIFDRLGSICCIEHWNQCNASWNCCISSGENPVVPHTRAFWCFTARESTSRLVSLVEKSMMT